MRSRSERYQDSTGTVQSRGHLLIHLSRSVDALTLLVVRGADLARDSSLEQYLLSRWETLEELDAIPSNERRTDLTRRIQQLTNGYHAVREQLR